MHEKERRHGDGVRRMACIAMRQTGCCGRALSYMRQHLFFDRVEMKP